MNKSMWNNEAVKAYESGQGVMMVKEPHPHYVPIPQRTWEVLKDKEIEEIWKIAMFTDYGIGAELSNQPFVHYAKAIEAKLKEKNGL